MLKSVYYTNDKFRNELIKIAMFCSETELTSFVRTFSDAAALFNKSSNEVYQLFSVAAFSTEYSEKIDALKFLSSETHREIRSQG